MSNAATHAGVKSGAGSVPSTETAKKVLIALFSLAIVGLGIALLVYGWDYYSLSLQDRPLSPKHPDLRPSGTIGLKLGMSGLALLAMVYLYPLRKHWPFLGRFGRTRNWFDYHVMLGLTAPVLITFHAAFKISGFAGMAYWTMIALVVSGVIGRYFYSQIPRNIGAAEMSLKEMEDLKAELLRQLQAQSALRQSEIEGLYHLPASRDIQSMPLYKSLIYMVALDLVRPLKVWRLRRRGLKEAGRRSWFGGILPARNPELEKAVLLASRQAMLSKRILFLSQAQRVFHGWHVIHRPFSISIAAFVIIHVAVVTWLGYF